MPQVAEIDAKRFGPAELGPGDDALDDALPSSSKISLRSKARGASWRSSLLIVAAVAVMQAFSNMERIKSAFCHLRQCCFIVRPYYPVAPISRQPLLFVRHQAQLPAAPPMPEVAEGSLNEGVHTTGAGTTSKAARRGRSRLLAKEIEDEGRDEPDSRPDLTKPAVRKAFGEGLPLTGVNPSSISWSEPLGDATVA